MEDLKIAGGLKVSYSKGKGDSKREGSKCEVRDDSVGAMDSLVNLWQGTKVK